MLRSPRLLRSTALTIDGSSPGSPPAAFGPFRVLHQVGAGTTGLVFRAHDAVEGRLVAIKAFRLDLTPERAAELAQSLQALAERGLSHPSIAAPIGAGVEDGVAWFAQAYVPAESLDSALRQYGPPPVADALTIITQLAGALDFAAAGGVVHGSLHPRDVLVAPGETHLVDIGVAAALERCGMRAPVRRPYSAPERAAGGSISRAGDTFALGAITFELLSGQPVTGAGDDVITALPDVPGADREALLETFSFALALAPDERYATALAFAASLKRALGEALTRPAPPRKRRTTRPPEAMLPVGGLESEPPVEDSGAAPPVVDSHDTAATLAGPVPADDEHVLDAAGPMRRTPRRAGLPERAEDPAPAYLSGPTEPEPSAPAIEPIAAPGEADPLALDGRDGRYASLDERDVLSPLDAAELHAAAEPADRWDMAEPATPEESVEIEGEDIAGAERRFTEVEDDDYANGRGRASAVAAHQEPAPGAGAYDRDYAAAPVTEAAAPARAPWLALAAMLLVGLAVGFAGGWMLLGGRADRSSAGADAAAVSGDANAAGAQPREWTDDPVRQPGGPGPEGAAAPSPTPSTSGPAPEPRTPETPPATAAARQPEAAPRGRLVVRTRPAGARVEVAGRSRGVSPATVADLAYGQHTVRLSREGYATEQLRVSLSARQPARTVDVTLRRTPAAAAPAQRATRASAGGFVGTLVVESRPAGAKVFVDGRGVGTTPVTLPGVRVGSHVVRIERTGYRRWSTSVRVVAGERERVAASLEEEAAR